MTTDPKTPRTYKAHIRPHQVALSGDLTWLSEEEGGRENPPRGTTYHTNCRFGDKDWFTFVLYLHPTHPTGFMLPTVDLPRALELGAWPGQEMQICEGPRLVGTMAVELVVIQEPL